MNRFWLAMIAATFALALCPASASAQAAAESVLLNAHSAAVTANAGSALGSALNRATAQIGGKIQQVSPAASGKIVHVQPKPTKTAAKSAAVAPSTPTAQGPMITSISGAQTKRTPAKPENEKYKSSVTVSFPN